MIVAPNGLRQSTRGSKRAERLSPSGHIAREEEVGPETRPRSSMIFSLKSSGDSESGHADQLVECLPSCVCTPIVHQLVMVVHAYTPSTQQDRSSKSFLVTESTRSQHGIHGTLSIATTTKRKMIIILAIVWPCNQNICHSKVWVCFPILFFLLFFIELSDRILPCIPGCSRHIL